MAKILLVEDDKSLREIYGIRLVAEGYETISAGDGEEALAVAVREKPDLILSDVMMPKISGFDMLDIIRSTPETKDIKVIMMTALSAEDQRQRGESLGADKYLVKSQVGIEDVVNAVHEVMGDRMATNEVAAPAVQTVQPADQEATAIESIANMPEEIAEPVATAESATIIESVATTEPGVAVEPAAETKVNESLMTNTSTTPGIESGAMDIAQMIGDTEEPEAIPIIDQQPAESTTQSQSQNNKNYPETESPESKKNTGNIFAQPEEEVEITTNNTNIAQDPNEAARLRKILDDEIAKMESAGVVKPTESETETKAEMGAKPAETLAQDQNAAQK